MDHISTTPEIAAVAIPNYLCKLLVWVKSRSDSNSAWSKTIRCGADCTISMQALVFAALNKLSEALIHEVRSWATSASRVRPGWTRPRQAHHWIWVTLSGCLSGENGTVLSGATGTPLRKSSAYAAGEKYGCDTDFLVIPLSSFPLFFWDWWLIDRLQKEHNAFLT